jgi:hypothetical protein
VTLKQVIEGQSRSNGAERHENDTERIQGGEAATTVTADNHRPGAHGSNCTTDGRLGLKACPTITARRSSIAHLRRPWRAGIVERIDADRRLILDGFEARAG